MDVTTDSILEILGGRGAAHSFRHLTLQSLEATRLATELSSKLGIRVPIRLVFESQDLEDFVRRVSALSSGEPILPSHLHRLDESERRQRSKLSFAQDRMAFMHAMTTGSAAYHVCFGLRMRGHVNEAALETALNSLVDRHDVLRTRFVAASEGVITVAVDAACMPLTILSKPTANGAASEDELMMLASELCNAPFNLDQGQTARATLIRRTSRDSLLVLAFHHIVMDQWSYELLLDELADTYTAAIKGMRTRASVRDDGFAAYSRWHRHWFRECAFMRERKYWLKQLEGAQRVSIEGSLPRPVVASFRGARQSLSLDEAGWGRLEGVATDAGSSLAMLLFAAMAVMVRDQSGQSDITIGMPVANRNHKGADTCFGPLVNTLAIRVKLDDSNTFHDLLQNVRAQFLDAFENQDLPFELLIDQLRLVRQPGLSPLFGVMFNMLNTPAARISMPDLDLERVEIDRQGAQFDLTITVDRLHTRTIWFEYATDLYSHSDIARLAQRYRTLLDEIALRPGSSLYALPQVAAEEALLLRAWGRGAPVGTEPCLFARVSGIATSRPDALATQCSGQTLTYGALLHQSMQVSHSLRGMGIGTGDLVGLMLPRSNSLPVAILGTLAAGAGFVPLDPDFPIDRLAFMCRDAGLKLIIADDPASTAKALQSPDFRIIELSSLLGGDTAKFSPFGEPDDVAYVLYTSGSSGVPKGVVVLRRALDAFLAAMRERPGIRASDRLLAVTTLSFDISLLELLLPLTVGAEVVIATREQALDGHALGELLSEHDITIMQATPSTWYQLLQSGWRGTATLRALCGGERLPIELAARLEPMVGELWNMYGPTETTVWSTCARIELCRNPRIAVGRPIAGTSVAVVDSLDRLAGIGVRGEILIGGAGVARGYLGRPDLTAERFAHFPGIHPDRIHYRTGDYGRWNDQGQLECLGRMDSQLKIRGHRIEPGEIESIAGKVPGVTRAVVATTKVASWDVRLQLYVTSDTPSATLANAVRTRLREQLPEFMIPQQILPMLTLPLLPNGKIDAATLALAQSPAETRSADPPESELEYALHGLWSELLCTGPIGRSDNFFNMGGHSLLAMRLATRIREDLHRHCTVSQVFQHPTLSALAVALTTTGTTYSSSVVMLASNGVGPAIFCICGVQLYRAMAANLGVAPVFAAYVPMESGDRRGRRATINIEALAKTYLEMIREEQPHGPYRLLGFSMGGVIAYEIAQQLHRAGESVDDLVILDSDAPGEKAFTRLGRKLTALRTSMRGSTRPEGGLPLYLAAIRAYVARPYPGRAFLIEAELAQRYNPRRGWRGLIRNLSRASIASDHLGLMTTPKVLELTALLRARLSNPEGSRTIGTL